jgi:hypothetical protein
MKVKLLTFLILLSSLLVYLEWSKTERMFLFEIEATILWKFFTDFSSVLHPFIILPFVGQMLLIFSLFQKRLSKWVIYLGISMLSVLIVFIFLIGLLSLHVEITLFAMPFIVLSVLQVRNLRKL